MKLSAIIYLAFVILSQFITVSSDCIRFDTTGSSETYGRSGHTGCLDFVTINTTYTDSQGNLRHGPIRVLTSDAGSMANRLSPIIGICILCIGIYLAF